MPANAFFHEFPVIWMLPGARNKSDSGFSETTYQNLDSLPEDVPRVFLSHMPTRYFEYALSPNTKIIYLLREPHAVWRSMMKFNERFYGVLNDLLDSMNDTKRRVNDSINAATFTWDFNRGR